MELDKAKRVIASYVTGSRTSREDLDEAIMVANTAPDYVRDLCHKFDVHGFRQRECAVFLANVAEFAEMSAQMREKEMPELVDHMHRCPSCLKAYWEVACVWSERGGVKVGEPLVVLLGTSGSMSPGQYGPPASTPVAQAAWGAPGGAPPGETPAGQPSPGTSRIEWELEDHDAALKIRVVVEPDERKPDELTLACVVEPFAWSDVTPDEIDVTVIDNKTAKPYFHGPLRVFSSGRFFLLSNSNLLRFTSRTRDLRYEIPLDLRSKS